MDIMNKQGRGFTIVELLIVIVVIAILAAITIVAYNGIQSSARNSKAKADIANLAKAVHAAKLNTGNSFVTITASMGGQSTGAGRNCWNKVDGTDLAAVARTDACWTDYFTALQLVSNASGINVNGMIDPWGRPYYIDQNEGENIGGNFCVQDKISTYRLPFVTGSANDDTAYRTLIPNVTSGC